MAIEKGIRLGPMTLAGLRKSGGLEAALKGFQRFYIGPEFCENLLGRGLCGEAAWLQEKGKKVCLLTPMISEKGAGLLDSIFKDLLKLVKRGKLDPAGLEITANDFGAIELAKRNRLPFKLNAGRLLRNTVFNDCEKSLTVNNGLALDFFSELGINRYELSTIGAAPRINFNQGRRYGFDRRSFKITLYYPYLNLTSTRTCLVGMRDVPPEEAARGVACSRECLISSFELAHPSINEKMLIRGNTVFLEFAEQFYTSEKDLARINVDRLVYAPFP